MSDLRNEVEKLTPEQKVELLDAVWESLEAGTTLTEERRRELDRRIARHVQNPADVIPWERVKAGLLKKR